MVDWSAAAAPRTGKDSIWIGVTKRDIRFRPTFEAINPATRDEAMKTLGDILADLRRRNERVLVGFDFPLGYPEGTAAKLALKSPDWSGLWAFLASNVVDKPTNVNNRFAVAAKMNRLMTDQPWPFWGCPANGAQRSERWIQQQPVGLRAVALGDLARVVEHPAQARAVAGALFPHR
eukprot:gene10382-biopygen8697